MNEYAPAMEQMSPGKVFWMEKAISPWGESFRELLSVPAKDGTLHNGYLPSKYNLVMNHMQSMTTVLG